MDEVLQSSLSLTVLQIDILVRVDFVVVYVLSKEFVGAIIGGVIDEDDKVVGVVLPED